VPASSRAEADAGGGGPLERGPLGPLPSPDAGLATIPAPLHEGCPRAQDAAEPKQCAIRAVDGLGCQHRDAQEFAGRRRMSGFDSSSSRVRTVQRRRHPANHRRAPDRPIFRARWIIIHRGGRNSLHRTVGRGFGANFARQCFLSTGCLGRIRKDACDVPR